MPSCAGIEPVRPVIFLEISLMNNLYRLLLLLVGLVNTATARPNIVFIYTDDQAPRAVNAAGDKRFITPNIDRIFHEGAHLTNAFVTTPVCSPSRAGLIASRYSSEINITDWINPRAEKTLGLAVATPTWPQHLVQAGYKTALVGKWHLGTQDRFHPTRFGYQQFMGIRTGGCPPKNARLEQLDGVTRKFDGYTCDIFTDHVLDFIRQERKHAFAVSLHFRAPHAAWLPVRPEDWAPFKDLDPMIPKTIYDDINVALVKKRTREYLAAVKSVDRNVGRVLGLLEELKLVENTIVIFTSDHGYNLGDHGVWFKGNAHWVRKPLPPKRWKQIPALRRPNLWDTSLRVPAAVRWPGVIKPGTKITQTITNLDWFPTLLAMAGVALPKNTGVRGRDFTPLLQGKRIPWDNDLYAEYSMHHGATTHMRAWRTPEWKYMRDFAHAGREELYDLKNDPDEFHNLATSTAARHVAAKADLARRILQQMTALKDPVLPSR
ncbi:MAG: N-acetylgalactosamine 6-sulfate sulfatase [Planctomycetaceae bacterium]|nr:N-acetylgalactosamine 6-sulfate sulfatase [Planctomycetaceae bacterium]